jgi:SAM-dependent methyltransferase
MDHPGHYLRRIKSVALTVPCVVGPYSSMNCTLRLLEHQFRTSSVASNKDDYVQKIDESDGRFSTVNVPISAIAVSTGQNDSGVFELNFRDERYIPFEGAGVISKWRIELPADFRQFDYDTISDVILHLRYTAVEGGDQFKAAALDAAREFFKSTEEISRQEGLFAFFDLKHDFPSEWYQANNLLAGVTERVFKLSNLSDRLPLFTRSWLSGKKPTLTTSDIYLFSAPALKHQNLSLNEAPFSDGLDLGPMKAFTIKDEIAMDNWTLKIQDTQTQLEKLWLIVRYVLKKN